MSVDVAAFRQGLERGLLRGKSWRQDPYPGPLDLLRALRPDLVETPALRCISDHLVAAVVAAETTENPDYLAVSMGPQEGKSTLIAFAFPIWLWLRNPDLRILIISYDNETAFRWGRAVKNALKQHGGDSPLHGVRIELSLQHGSEAVSRLELDGYEGSISCMSLKGGISGKPGDVVILDDVVKDRATARSKAFKELWSDQWESAIVPRLGKTGLAVMDHTRWAEDDPIGQQLADHGDRWTYLNIPAVLEKRPHPTQQHAPNLGSENKVKADVPDPLGRAIGEWMVSARGRTPAEWQRKRDDVGEANFWALYQGQPFPAAGGLFKANRFRYWQATGDRWVVSIPGRPGPDEQLLYAFRFITVDLAASTRTSADWTVAAAWAVSQTGELLLLDLIRVQVDPSQHWDEAVAPLVSRWNCKVFVEASQHGTDLIYTASREGVALEAVHADSDKYTRAVPAARKLGQGMILFPPAAHWMADFEDEVLAFPTGSHDDQVDVLSYAHRVQGEFWVPSSYGRMPVEPPRADPMEAALPGGDVQDWDSVPL